MQVLDPSGGDFDLMSCDILVCRSPTFQLSQPTWATCLSRHNMTFAQLSSTSRSGPGIHQTLQNFQVLIILNISLVISVKYFQIILDQFNLVEHKWNGYMKPHEQYFWQDSPKLVTIASWTSSNAHSTNCVQLSSFINLNPQGLWREAELLLKPFKSTHLVWQKQNKRIWRRRPNKHDSLD